MSEETIGTEFDEDLSQPRTTNRQTSRRTSAGKKVTQVTKREFLEPDEGEERLQLPGMFALSDVEEHSIVRIRVYRKDPDEGMVGYIEDPGASEDEIFQRWGGSQYRIDGLNQTGQVKATRTFRIAGDPVFVSTHARLDWEKRKGITHTPVGQATGEQLTLRETLALMQQNNQERAAQEEARSKREAQERRDHEERMRKLELDAEDRRRKDENEREERRRKDDIEREERRQKAAAEAEERHRKSLAESDARSQAHLTMMMQLMKTGADQALAAVKQQAGGGIMDAVKTVVAIKQAFEGDGGDKGGDDDPLTLLMKHGHEWLGAAGNAAKGIIQEVKGQQTIVRQPQAPQLNPATDPNNLVIPRSSPIAGKLEHLVGTIASRGQNPEVVLANVIDNLQATLDRSQAPASAPPVVTPPVSEPPVSEPPVAAAPEPPAAPAVTQQTDRSRAKVSVEKTPHGSSKISFV
jgi:hypothetical protein